MLCTRLFTQSDDRGLGRRARPADGDRTALGIVMERFDLTNEQAFALPSRLSSHTNRKLHDVAAEISTTRRLPG